MRLQSTSAAVAAAVGLATAANVQRGPLPANVEVYQLFPRQAGSITVDPSKTFQKMDGFGFSLAFQRANLITNLRDKDKQRQLLDLLFNTTTGAGFSILRNGIGSSPDSSSDHMNSFQPKNPGGPTAKPNYQFDGKDSGQLWVAQEAYKTYGVRTFYADSWSAPGYMKSNGNEANGGSLSKDWYQAFANYLLAYVGFYKDAGVIISHLGFLNEPEFSASYASMNSQGAVDFIKVLQKGIEANNLTDTLGITCCDSEGWGNQVGLVNSFKSGGVDQYMKAYTTHTYTGGASGSMNTKVPVWLSEQCDLNGAWTTGWSGSGAGDGMTWGGNIMNAILNNNVGGYLYWEGVQWPNPNTNEKIIKVDNNTNTYEVAKRLWAFAQFRYVRPGAIRLGTSAASSGLRAAAFKNIDGSYAVVVLNTGTSAASLSVKITGVTPTQASLYVTDNTHQCEKIQSTLTEGTAAGSVPGRGMGTFFFPAPAAPAPESVPPPATREGPGAGK